MAYKFTKLVPEGSSGGGGGGCIQAGKAAVRIKNHTDMYLPSFPYTVTWELHVGNASSDQLLYTFSRTYNSEEEFYSDEIFVIDMPALTVSLSSYASLWWKMIADDSPHYVDAEYYRVYVDSMPAISTVIDSYGSNIIKSVSYSSQSWQQGMTLGSNAALYKRDISYYSFVIGAYYYYE